MESVEREIAGEMLELLRELSRLPEVMEPLGRHEPVLYRRLFELVIKGGDPSRYQLGFGDGKQDAADGGSYRSAIQVCDEAYSLGYDDGWNSLRPHIG